MQLNCTKTRQAMTELEKLVQESNDKDLHIISLQEPSWQITKADRLAGFKGLRGHLYITLNDIGVGGWSRTWQFSLTLCSENVLT
jgi:hypothetical protein